VQAEIWVKSSRSATNLNCVQLRWHKSSRSHVNGCVEVAERLGEVLVRDSKNPGGGVLKFSELQFRLFVDAVKAGEFG